MKMLSFSQISTFERCPRLWHYLYVDKEHVPKDPALEFGSFVHEIIRMLLTSKPMNNFPTKPKKTHLEEVPALIGWAEKAKNYLREIKVNDYEVEKEAIFGDFHGILDVIGVDNHGKYHVVDWKTTSYMYSQHDIITSLQLTAYAYLCFKIHNVLPRVHFGVFEKSTGLFASYTSTRTVEDIKGWEERLVSVLERTKNYESFKNPGSCYDYGKRCHFYNRCWPPDEIVFEGGVRLPMIGGGYR